MKRCLKMLLLSAAIFVMAMMVRTKDVKAGTLDPVKYIDADGKVQTCTDYEEVASATTAFNNGKWYVVKGDVTVSSTIYVSGTAHLILCDGASLTVNGSSDKAGIQVSSGDTLKIYGQSKGSGKLEANGGNYGAGIGGSKYPDSKAGIVEINGGVVKANGGNKGAGIGGGGDGLGDGGTVVINGGEVTATGGSDGAGIGGGEYRNGETIEINGGVVKAIGGGRSAGIGGGYSGVGGNITINGGTVTAAGSNGTGGIGGGGSISLTVNDKVIVKAGNTYPPTEVKEHKDGGIIELKNETYYITKVPDDPVTPSSDPIITTASGNTVYRVVILASGDEYVCYRQGSTPDEREYIDYDAEEFNLTQEEAGKYYLTLTIGENSRFLQGFVCHSLKGYLQDLALQDNKEKTVVFDNLDTTYEIHLVSAEEFQIIWNN